MKQFFQIVILWVAFNTSIGTVSGQDLSHLILAAHYSLINTAGDSLGLQIPIELINTTFSGMDGVYSNGIYYSDSIDVGSLIQTPFLAALFDSTFAFQTEFKMEKLDLPVLVCGSGYRYLGIGSQIDSTLYLLFNNGIHGSIPGVKVVQNQWYVVTIIHHTLTSLTEVYLDGVKVFEWNSAIMRVMSDGNISNTNFGQGRTFKGYLRNLKVYGSEVRTAIHNLHSQISELKPFPIPATTSLNFECTTNDASYWQLKDMNGALLKSGSALQGINKINIGDLKPGMYILSLLDIYGAVTGVSKCIKVN